MLLGIHQVSLCIALAAGLVGFSGLSCRTLLMLSLRQNGVEGRGRDVMSRLRFPEGLSQDIGAGTGFGRGDKRDFIELDSILQKQGDNIVLHQAKPR